MSRTTDLLATCSLAFSIGCRPDTGCSADCEYDWVLIEGPFYWADDWSGAGTSLAVGDVDADGLDEILVGQTCQHPDGNCWYQPGGTDEWTTGAFLLDAPFEGGRIEDVMFAAFGVPTRVTSTFGTVVNLPGDLTGDGDADIVVWGDRADKEWAGEEGWHVIAGPFAAGVAVSPTEAAAVVADAWPASCGGWGCMSAAPCRWDDDDEVDLCTVDGVARGPLHGEYPPEGLCAGFEARRVTAADLDGDGVDEVVVEQDGGSSEQATLSVLPGGRPCGDIDLVAEAKAVWTYPNPRSLEQLLAGPDLDGDGLGDIVFAQAVWDAGEGTTTPTVWVFDGDQGGAVAEAAIRFEFFDWGDRDIPLAAGDFDGDGAVDLAIGLSDLWVGIFRGPLSPGVYSERDADALLTACSEHTCDGPASCYDDGSFASTLASGDLDGDGRADLVIGAPEMGSESGGQVYIAWGGGL